MKLGKQITDLEMENMDKKRELIKSMFKTAIKMQKELTFTDPTKATDAETVGVMISQYMKWNGQTIFDVAYNAFEDANFHSFNEKFEELWEKSLEQPSYNFKAKIKVKEEK